MSMYFCKLIKIQNLILMRRMAWKKKMEKRGMMRKRKKMAEIVGVGEGKNIYEELEEFLWWDFRGFLILEDRK